MKRFISYLPMLFALLLAGCDEDLQQVENITAPGSLQISTEVSQDGSGIVHFKASSSGAMTYHYYFGLNDTEKPVVAPGGEATFAYRSSGIYQVRVVAYGAGGIATNGSTEVEVEVTYEAPADLIQTLTNGSTRTWVWKKTIPAHLGVGPEFYDDGSIGDAPIWWSAGAFEKEAEGCLYEDKLIFTLAGDGSVQFTNENNGVSYFHVDEAADALGVARPAADQCFDYDVSASANAAVGFFLTGSGIASSTGIGMELGNSAFMSYFLNSSTYEIMSYSADELYVRTVQDIDGFRLAWYQKFIAEDVLPNDPGVEYELVWSDEFDTDGAPNAANWAYDLGNGDNGWGNAEIQFYTDRSDNVSVAGGNLNITAKRESFSGFNFTSARLKTEGKFDFQYGKVEVRAKLPKGGGTWPAIWLLGSDYQTNTWPACGEIDIMEHVGNTPDLIYGTLHSPSSFGDSQNKGTVTIAGATDDFHVYGLEWTEESITMFVDGEPFYSYAPQDKNADNWPFDKPFFLILNVAMGGTFGGEVDGNFTSGTMEIDYVHVYQAK